MKKTIILSILIFILSLNFSGLSFAWEMTEELQKEIDQKLKTLEKNPDDPHAHFDLAITYAYTNHVEEGWEELKKVNEMDEGFAQKAFEMYSKEAEANPNDWKIRFRLAFSLYFLKEKEKAIEEMKRIVEMEPKDDPKRIWANAYTGLIYGEIDEVDQALKYTKKAIKIDSNVAALHVLLASAYYKKGDGWGAFWEGMEALRLKSMGY